MATIILTVNTDCQWGTGSCDTDNFLHQTILVLLTWTGHTRIGIFVRESDKVPIFCGVTSTAKLHSYSFGILRRSCIAWTSNMYYMPPFFLKNLVQENNLATLEVADLGGFLVFRGTTFLSFCALAFPASRVHTAGAMCVCMPDRPASLYNYARQHAHVHTQRGLALLPLLCAQRQTCSFDHFSSNN